MRECIFCGIRDGAQEKGVIYRDDTCFVILDGHPLSRGHMLVISNNHYADIIRTPDAVAAHMFVKAKEFSKISRDRLKADGINIGVNTGAAAGQLIMHAHIHVIPRYLGGGKSFGFGRRAVLRDKDRDELVKLLSDR